MKHLMIVYHSGSSRTHRLALAARHGASQEPDVEVRTKTAFAAGLDDLLWADGLLLGTPENFGYMSGALKDFFDRTFYPAQPYQLNLPYALFISAGNDGTGAARAIERIVLGYPLRKVAEPVIASGELDDSHLQRAEELGLALAAGLALGIF